MCLHAAEEIGWNVRNDSSTRQNKHYAKESELKLAYSSLSQIENTKHLVGERYRKELQNISLSETHLPQVAVALANITDFPNRGLHNTS